MSESGQPERVLVTGGTGYLAAWVMAGLLRRGYRVRTTVRSLAKAQQVRDAVAEEAGAERAETIEFAVADLLADEGWDEAVRDVAFVLHTASPLGTTGGQDLVTTAREGVARVLAAAARAHVKRVVFTSSGVAVTPDDPTQVGDETVWATVRNTPSTAYNDSKILAEQDAWEIARREGFELTTVLPTFVLGPALGASGAGGSIESIRRLLTGSMPAIPHISWNVVDVRDVAELHILAMTSPEAAGQRFIGFGESIWWHDIAEILRRDLPAESTKVPTRSMPDLVVKVLARFDPQLAALRPRLSRRALVDGDKARRTLNWHPRPIEQTIVDTARTLSGTLSR